MRKDLVVSALFLFACSTPSLAQEAALVERWDRAVCLLSPESGKANSVKYASAFLVSAGEDLYLVTAEHAAAETQKKTRMLFRSAKGSSEWVSFDLLFEHQGDPWKRAEHTDLAVAIIPDTERAKPYREMLAPLVIPIDQLSELTPRRTTAIDVAGYPLGLGVRRHVSPLVVSGHVASKEIKSDTKWGTETLFYSFPPLAQGTSGGPVFLTDEDPTAVTVVGMYIGVLADASGGKLSKLIPSHVIRAAIAPPSAE